MLEQPQINSASASQRGDNNLVKNNDSEQLQILADDLANLINEIQPAENITFLSAEQGSNYDDYQGLAYAPLKKAEGRSDWDVAWGGPNCQHTSYEYDSSKNWWETTLDRQYAISTVKIFSRDDFPERAEMNM